MADKTVEVVITPELETWMRNKSALAGNLLYQDRAKKEVRKWLTKFATFYLEDCTAIQVEELAEVSVREGPDATVPDIVASFKHRGKRGEVWHKAQFFLGRWPEEPFDWDGGGADKVIWVRDGQGPAYYPGTKDCSLFQRSG